MGKHRPHFFVLLETHSDHGRAGGRWRFVLENMATGQRFEAGDKEPDASGERLDLLAMVRALEALPGPARVTLVTTSRPLSRSLRVGLPAWRANNWTWEQHGRYVPIRNADLWRRVDRALRYHEVECRVLTMHVGDGVLPEQQMADTVTTTADRRRVRWWRNWLVPLERWAQRLRSGPLPVRPAVPQAG